MAKYTTNLNLYEKESTDGKDYFSISSMLNDNWDKIDVEIGTIRGKIHSSVSNISGLKAIDISTISDNILIFVKSLGLYSYDSTSSATGNDNTIITPTTGSGRWIKIASINQPMGNVVGDTDTQTLTNKTLTSPVISTISNTGTLTLPSSTDTLIGRNTTDTLTNKTLTTPTLTLKQSTEPTPTIEGDIQWDTDNDRIVVGNGTNQSVFYNKADNDLTYIKKVELNLQESIKGTTQTPTITNGQVTQILHKDSSNNTIRTDAFNYSVSNQITETRTLNTGETLTIVYHLDTLVVEVS